MDEIAHRANLNVEYQNVTLADTIGGLSSNLHDASHSARPREDQPLRQYFKPNQSLLVPGDLPQYGVGPETARRLDRAVAYN